MSDELSTDGFVSEEIGGPPEVAPEPAPEPEAQEQPEGDDPESPEGDEPEAGAKPRKSAAERIAELTRARREAERDAEHWRKVAEGKAPAQQAEPEAAAKDAEPNPDDFDYGEADPLYLKAVVAYETKKALDADRQNRAQESAQQAQARVWETFQAEARAKHSDFDSVVIESAAKGDWPCTPEMAQAALTSQNGADVLYHLATNPAEARRIASLDNPLAQAREMGRLEAILSQPAPKKTTNAPQPPDSSARGAGGRFTVAPDTDDFAAFEKAYANGFN